MEARIKTLKQQKRTVDAARLELELVRRWAVPFACLAFALLGVPLAIMAWGRRWLGPAESDTTLTHAPCGADLHVKLSCGACAEPISLDTIALDERQ